MKKFLCMLLALTMLFSCTTVLFSCKKNDAVEDNGGTETKKYEEDSLFYERSLVEDGLEEKDFKGRVFRIVETGGEVYVAEEARNQGNLLLDAKFTRNQAVENRFNVKIERVYSGNYVEVNDYATKTILAGSDEFDLLMGQVLETATSVPKNLFLNWYDIENIDFTKPWWFETTSTNLSYNDKAILAISHLNHSAVSGVYCFFFNKNLAASYELGDLYKLVLDGKWTFDAMMEMVKDVYVDNGDDVRDEKDFYGLAHNSGTGLNAYLWAFDNPICTKDADGKPQLSLKSDKIDSIIGDIYDLCYNTNGVFYDKTGEVSPSQLFYEKRSIFMQNGLDEATTEKLRNFEDEYGILPMPKFDETQKEYLTMVGGHHSVLAIPKTAKDTEFIGTIVEAMSAESWKTVTPTLYEIALKTRYLRDSESKEIMDIIINNVVFDFGYVYNTGFSYILQNMMREGNSNFQSYYSKNKTNANYKLKQVLKAFSKL
ncbi:MAG: hypothetical protein IKV53_00735 [Clostridia bacterium]|nr:hypothetical protein [Clostridia bacterium]